jgi:hypothetical protein
VLAVPNDGAWARSRSARLGLEEIHASEIDAWFLTQFAQLVDEERRQSTGLCA